MCPDAIFVTCGTETTQAGLILGNKVAGTQIRIIGQSVARKADCCKQEILSLLPKSSGISQEMLEIMEPIMLYDENGEAVYRVIKEVAKTD